MADEPVGPYGIPKITGDDPVQRVRYADALAIAINNGLTAVAGEATEQVAEVQQAVTDLGPGYAKLSTLPDGTNLNTLNVAGLHRISSTNVETMTGLPSGFKVAAILENQATGTPGQVSWWVQRLEEYGEGARSWRRSSSDTSGGWGPWVVVSEQSRIVTEWHVFLAAGQSNMVGRAAIGQQAGNSYVAPRVAQFGATRRALETASVPLDMNAPATGLSPATTFAHSYLRNQPPHVGVLLVPAARGDTGFTTSTTTYTWIPGVATTTAFGLPELAVQQTKDAITAAKSTGAIVELKGILWHQGEYNSSTAPETYTAALDNLIVWFRAQLSAPIVPFLVGQMVPEGIAASTSGRANIDAVQEQTPGRILYTGFAPAAAGAHLDGDTTHMNQTGVEYIGRTYLDALGRALRNDGTSKAYTDEKDSSNRSAWAAADALLTPLSRGILNDGVDLNSLNRKEDAGTYGLQSSRTYVNAPASSNGSTCVLEVGYGGTNAIVQRVTFGASVLWRESASTTSGTWSEWAQAETVEASQAKAAAALGYTDAEVAKDRVRLDNVEARNVVQDGSLIVFNNGFAKPPVEYAPDASTRGLWHFNNTLTDASGAGRTLTQYSTLNGSYSTITRFGAASLGGGIYEHVGADAVLSSTGADGGVLLNGTVECWVKSVPHTVQKVALSHRNWYWLGLSAAGKAMASYGTGGDEKQMTGTTIISGPAITTAPWHHIALVFINGAARLYVDGRLEASNEATAIAGVETGGGFTVGGLRTVRTYDWWATNGRIDEVRVSSKPRYLATGSYPARPATLRAGGALYIGPTLPADREPFDQWIKTETI